MIGERGMWGRDFVAMALLAHDDVSLARIASSPDDGRRCAETMAGLRPSGRQAPFARRVGAVVEGCWTLA